MPQVACQPRAPWTKDKPTVLFDDALWPEAQPVLLCLGRSRLKAEQYVLHSVSMTRLGRHDEAATEKDCMYFDHAPAVHSAKIAARQNHCPGSISPKSINWRECHSNRVELCHL